MSSHLPLPLPVMLVLCGYIPLVELTKVAEKFELLKWIISHKKSKCLAHSILQNEFENPPYDLIEYETAYELLKFLLFFFL